MVKKRKEEERRESEGFRVLYELRWREQGLGFWGDFLGYFEYSHQTNSRCSWVGPA